jgi:hypothetical protein
VAKHRNHSMDFKCHMAQAFISGETARARPASLL